MTKVDGEIGTWRGLVMAVATAGFVSLGSAPDLLASDVAPAPGVERLPFPADFTGWRRLEAGRRIAAGETVYCVTIRLPGRPMVPPRADNCFLGHPEEWDG